MNKKELLMTVLKKLSGHREYADGFLVFLESEFISDDSVDALYMFVVSAVEKIRSNIKERTYIAHMNDSQKMKRNHDENLQKDIAEAEELLKGL